MTKADGDQRAEEQGTGPGVAPRGNAEEQTETFIAMAAAARAGRRGQPATVRSARIAAAASRPVCAPPFI